MTVAARKAVAPAPPRAGPEARIVASPAPLRAVGFLANGEGGRELCLRAVLEIANAFNRLPSCIDLLDCTGEAALDLILLSRRPADPVREPYRLAGDLILRSSAPVLVLPNGPRAPTIGERVMIIWDGSLSAASALRAAAPLIGLAREVMLVDAPGDTSRRAVEQAAAFLRRLPGKRLVDVARLMLDSKAAVLDAALLGRADYAVLGGFGRWNMLPDILYRESDSPLLGVPIPLVLGQ